MCVHLVTNICTIQKPCKSLVLLKGSKTSTFKKEIKRHFSCNVFFRKYSSWRINHILNRTRYHFEGAVNQVDIFLSVVRRKDQLDIQADHSTFLSYSSCYDNHYKYEFLRDKRTRRSSSSIGICIVQIPCHERFTSGRYTCMTKTEG